MTTLLPQRYGKLKGFRPSFLAMNTHHTTYRHMGNSQLGTILGGSVKKNFTDNAATFNNGCALRLSYALNKCGFYIPKVNPFPGTSVFCSERWEVMSGVSQPAQGRPVVEFRNIWEITKAKNAIKQPPFGRTSGFEANICKVDFRYELADEDSWYYIFRQKLMKFYLMLVLGQPCFEFNGLGAGSEQVEVNLDFMRTKIGGKRGIIVYEFFYSGGTGHCDMWDGENIDNPGVRFDLHLRKTMVSFWELP